MKTRFIVSAMLISIASATASARCIPDLSENTELNGSSVNSNLTMPSTEASRDSSNAFFSVIINSNIVNNITEKKQGSAFKSSRKFEEHFPFVYWGATRLTGSPSIGITGSYAGIPQNTGKSYEWGMYLFRLFKPVTLNRQRTIAVTSSFGFAQTINRLKDDYMFVSDGNSTDCIQSKDDYSKTWLRTWSLRLPVCVEFQIPVKGRKSSFFFSVGPEVDYKLSVLSRGKLNGKKRTIDDDLDINRFGLNLLMQIGYGHWGFISRMGLTPIFRQTLPENVYNSMFTFFVYL